ncbi:MAG TPA: BrnA antitoxin family protein [Acidobacteriaceae bacterium]
MKRLRATKDEDIDYSDIPSQRGALWTRPGALIPTGNKKQITVRLDADVLAFFKKTGTRYQSRINAALREYMKAHERAS